MFKIWAAHQTTTRTLPVIGINGFGRIGRTATRVWWYRHRHEMDLQIINTSGSMEIEDWSHLLKYDTNYGGFHGEIIVERVQSKNEVTDTNPVLGTITLRDQHSSQSITITAQKDPTKIPWGDNDVGVVLEATGAFADAEKASLHFQGGTKFVIISAPAKGDGVSSSVIGINDFAKDATVLSNVSCTTNNVAPVTEIMHQAFGIEKAMMTTIHSYTDDQNVQDNSHKDLRRARSAAENLVPTSTGAAVAVTEIIPELKGKFDGLSIRVPTPVGSLSDTVFVTKKPTSIEEVNQVFTEAAAQPRWHRVLAVTNDPIVSSDIIGRPESAIVDLSLTNVIDGNLVKVISWYDNEWGYCNRLIEQVLRVPR